MCSPIRLRRLSTSVGPLEPLVLSPLPSRPSDARLLKRRAFLHACTKMRQMEFVVAEAAAEDLAAEAVTSIFVVGHVVRSCAAEPVLEVSRTPLAGLSSSPMSLPDLAPASSPSQPHCSPTPPSSVPPLKLSKKKKKKTKIFIKVQGDISEPNHLRCAKELTAPTDPRQRRWK